MIKTEPLALRKRPPPHAAASSAAAPTPEDEPSEAEEPSSAALPSLRGTEVRWSSRTVRFLDLCSRGRWTETPPACGGLGLADSAWETLIGGGEGPIGPPVDDADDVDLEELRTYQEQGGWQELPSRAEVDDMEVEEAELVEPLQVELDEEEPTPELLLREAVRRLCSDEALWWQGLPAPEQQALARAVRPDAALSQPGAKRSREEASPSAEAARELLRSSGATGQCLKNWALAGQAELKLELLMLGLVD